MSRVFVVQLPHHTDPTTGELVSKFDITPAHEHGEVVFLLGPTAAPWNWRPIVEELHSKLHGFTSEDYILCIGNPILIGMATALAAAYNHGHVRLLQWSGTRRGYMVVPVGGLLARSSASA